MRYYAAQVRTRAEEKYIKLLKRLHPEIPAVIHAPKRTLDIRRRGAVVQTTKSIFPGYIFIELNEGENIIDYQWSFRKTAGFFRFLESNQNILALEDRDLRLVLHFIKKIGPVAGKSRVYFDENSRIVVVDGPLKGLEGNIIKVDKRKGRAKIKLDLYHESFAIDLAFEYIEPTAALVNRGP
ncbi:MAG: antiterminator LoaP [Spirochaetaceae bacterium]|jgi:transcriptional antiterminator NusG|nr:antiterminator LoaP [Spirochaetaceae bacterium]